MNLSEFKNILKRYNAKFEKLYRNEKWIRYHRCFCGFDIETTQLNEKAYMYIWQFSFKTDDIPQLVVKGRTWHEFDELLRFLNVRLGLRENTRLIIWIANMGFEFQFMRKRLDIDELFAKTPRNPLYIRCGGLEFREALAISQGSLAYLAETWTGTQKAIGDLDYSISRNSLTELTEKELGYCDNDVIILSEFSEKIFNDFIHNERYIPMTSTGILRHDLRRDAKASVKDPQRIYDWIKSLYPQSKADYLYIMEYLFRGGFVHACYKFADRILEHLQSFDLKSSYPAVAFQEYYPVSPFKPINNVSLSKLEELCKDYCVIFQATFYNIKSTTFHSIESRNKCVKVKNALLDNGRIHNADSITVFLTELDYQSYKEFYEWDSMELHNVEVAHRGTLPKYLLDRFYFWFEKKESINSKENPQEYKITKTRVNGHFGMCVTRLVFNEVTYCNGLWEKEEVNKSYDKMIEKQVLSPFWGVYIAAHARRRELYLLYKMKEETVYSDTDSHKLFYTDNVKKVVEEYNNMIDNKNKVVCEKYGYKWEILKNIGKFECETSEEEKGEILRFKTLGAKRYISEYKNKGFESTISGLGKQALNNFCKDFDLDPFIAFKNNLEIPANYTKKLTPIYNDEKHSDIVTDQQGNTEKMIENSSVYLKPVTFHLSMDKDYLNLIKFWLERIEKHGY